MKLAEKIVSLRIATRCATMCESVGGKRNNTLSLKTKILFLLSARPLTPSDLMTMLQLLKTNLAILTSGLVSEGLIVKEKAGGDGREIIYYITPAGKSYLNERLEVIETAAAKALKDDYDKAAAAMDEALRYLEYII